MASNNYITCAKHGDSSATYVCKHLVEKPAQRWYCDYPSEDKLWPDAWCEACEALFQAEGEWNEKNSDAANIKVLCSGCYESGLSSSLDYLEETMSDSWSRFVGDCCEALSNKQTQMDIDFDISRHKRWDYDQSTGSLTFSNDGVPAVLADIEMIGSLSEKKRHLALGLGEFPYAPPGNKQDRGGEGLRRGS